MIRGLPHRRGFGAAAAALLVLALACAEKTLAPSVSLSPRFTILVTTTAQRTAVPQKMVVAAAYFVAPQNGPKPGDTARVLDAAVVDITGGPQQVNLKVDLTNCLADPTRRGSRDACTMYIAAFLEPSTFDPDTSEWFGPSYDFQLLGPFDAAPGRPPAPAAIDLSVSHFAVNHWEPDGSLFLGGSLIPVGLTGPITGAVSGTGPPTLFALTQGQLPTKKPDSTFLGSVLGVYQNGAWRRVNGTLGVTFFVDVAAFSPTDAYLASNDGIGLYHFDGTSIAAVTGVREQLRSVAVSSASPNSRYLIAGTRNNSSVWVSDLTTFTKYTLPALATVDLVCINSATEAFATSRTNGSSVYRFDGTNWTSVPTPGTAGKSDLQCLGPGQAYVATQGTLYRWTGNAWTGLVGPSGANGRSMNFAVVSANEIYAAGDSSSTNRALYRFDGTSWREVGRLSFTTGFNKLWADPRGGAAYVSSASIVPAARIEVVTPTSASVLTYAPPLRDVAMPTPSSAFVVGGNFFLSRWNGARWTVDAPPAGTRATRVLNGVWADGPSNAWAVGQQSTIVHWDGARWNVASDSTRPIVFPSDNYNAVWGAGGTAWIVGDASIVRCSSTSSCSTDAQSGSPMYGVWGTSATNIYAVGAAGRILHFDGTSWSSMSSPTGARLSRVSGSSAKDVWAAGDTVVLHFDGSAWKTVTSSIAGGIITDAAHLYQSPTTFQTGLWAASASEVYYGTWYGRVFRGGGPNWGENPLAFSGAAGVMAIAGSPGGCALAVAEPGRSPTPNAPNLLRGVGPTGCLSAPMTAPSSWP
jgi:hypothetical protein